MKAMKFFFFCLTVSLFLTNVNAQAQCPVNFIHDNSIDNVGIHSSLIPPPFKLTIGGIGDQECGDVSIQTGISVGEMQAKLLQKVEELTLYMIELKKENEELKKMIQNNSN